MLINIYKNDMEYHIEKEKAEEYCKKYGFSMSLKRKKKEEKNANNSDRIEENKE